MAAWWTFRQKMVNSSQPRLHQYASSSLFQLRLLLSEGYYGAVNISFDNPISLYVSKKTYLDTSSTGRFRFFDSVVSSSSSSDCADWLS